MTKVSLHCYCIRNPRSASWWPACISWNYFPPNELIINSWNAFIKVQNALLSKLSRSLVLTSNQCSIANDTIKVQQLFLFREVCGYGITKEIGGCALCIMLCIVMDYNTIRIHIIFILYVFVVVPNSTML